MDSMLLLLLSRQKDPFSERLQIKSPLKIKGYTRILLFSRGFKHVFTEIKKDSLFRMLEFVMYNVQVSFHKQ